MSAAPLQLDTFLPYRLSITSGLVSEAVASVYSDLFGLTIPEWRIIAVVAESDGLTQQAIVERTLMDKVTVSRAAIALTRRGVLVRSTNPTDRRSLALTLSESGQALYGRIAPEALDLEKRLFGGFSATEIAAFSAMLRAIDVRAQAIDGRSASVMEAGEGNSGEVLMSRDPPNPDPGEPGREFGKAVEVRT